MHTDPGVQIKLKKLLRLQNLKSEQSEQIGKVKVSWAAGILVTHGSHSGGRSRKEKINSVDPGIEGRRLGPVKPSAPLSFQFATGGKGR